MNKIIILVLFTTTLSMANLYKPKYWSVAHEIIKIESEGLERKANFKLLDSLIDQVKNKLRLTIKPSVYTCLKTINEVLIMNNFLYKPQIHLIDALTPVYLTKSDIISIKKFDHTELAYFQYNNLKNKSAIAIGIKGKKHALKNLKEEFYLADCDTLTWIYIGIADVLNLPIFEVKAPNHSFVRWELTGSEYINWHATRGSEHTDEYVIEKTKIKEHEIESGKYMRSLSYNETLSHVYLRIATFYGKKEKFQEAFASSFYSLKLNKELYFAYATLGWLFKKNGDIENSIKYYEIYISFEPDDVLVLDYLAWLYVSFEKYRQPLRALILIEKALKIDPGKVLPVTYAAVLAENGAFDKALYVLEEAYPNVESKLLKDLYFAFRNKMTWIDFKKNKSH